MLKHPDEALMDDIGEMWSLECSPKYYVDCWMNMMQKFFDVNCGAVVKIYEEFENLIDVLNTCEDIEVIGNIYENKELKKNARIK